MAQKTPSDEDLMSYADGELSAPEAEAIALAIEKDAALLARVEMFRRSRDLARRAAAPIAAEPVPDALLKAIQAKIAAAAPKPAGEVISFPKRLAPRPAPWALPMAASIALALGGLAGYFARGGDAPAEIAQVVVGGPVNSVIGAILDRAASGSETGIDGGRVRMIATVRGQDQKLCREFEIDSKAGDTVIGLACRPDGAWRLQAAVGAPQSETGYAPASSSAAVDAYLDATEASEPLSAADEKAALDALR